MKRPIENSGPLGSYVYDPFVGSGTTIIACEMTGRSCLAMELLPAYVDVAVRRWEKFTGREAVLESTGETFVRTSERRSDSSNGGEHLPAISALRDSSV